MGKSTWAMRRRYSDSGRDKRKEADREVNMGSSVYCTPIPANGALIIANRNQLYAIAEKK